MDWDSERMDFYCDQNKYFSFDLSKADENGQNPYRKPQYMLLNLALGGDYGGAIDDTNPMPVYVSFVQSHPRMRGRDFLDIHTVGEYFAVDFSDPGFHNTVKKVFQAKRVDVRLLANVADEAVREFHRSDFESIAPTVRPGFELQGYDFYYNYVVEKCKLLEPLWHE